MDDIARFGAYLAGDDLIHALKARVYDVYSAEFELRVRHGLNLVDSYVAPAGEAGGALHYVRRAHDERAAVLIYLALCEGFYGDLRPDARRVAHCYRKDRLHAAPHIPAMRMVRSTFSAAKARFSSECSLSTEKSCGRRLIGNIAVTPSP